MGEKRRHGLIGQKLPAVGRGVPAAAAGGAPQHEAFERMWRQHRPRVWRLVARLAGQVDPADDLTQEVSLRAFQNFASFRGDALISTWLYRIAVNVVLRHRERERREPIRADAADLALLRAGETTDPEAVVLRGDLRPVVWAALERLPEEQRTTLILQVYEGLKYREIAAVLDIPIGTVKSRLHHAAEQLRKELKAYAL